MDPSIQPVASELGMQPLHIERLLEFCSGRIYHGRKLLLFVRASNEMSPYWHDQPGARPKHSGIKAKTNELGYVVHDSRVYYSDYDLQGVYVQQGRWYERLFTGNFVKLPDRVIGQPGLNHFLRVLNQYVCGLGAPKMFIHGAQDDYRDEQGRPQLQPKRDEKYLACFPDGAARVIRSSEALMFLYQELGIQWIYGPPSSFV